MQIAEGVHVFERPQRDRGFDLPSRSTALELGDGAVALVSPIDWSLVLEPEKAEEELRALGEVRYLIAPNLLHHLHLETALERFPGAQILGPRGLEKKRPALGGRYLALEEIRSSERTSDLRAALEWIPLEGAPSIREWAILHLQSRSLVLTDLVFHIREPRGFLTGLLLRMGGTHGKLASSRLFSAAVKDRAAMRSSIERLLKRGAELGVERILVAHGQCLEGKDAMNQLEAALRARFF